jgi:cyclopropane fatty-acyl-phospholipid synthase-like methyltransferase
MAWLTGIGALIALFFLISIVRGAPYLPTLQPQIAVALDLLDLQPGQLLVELGSGDGRVVKAAAERGYRAIGYEINPILYVISRLRCLRQRSQVTLQCRDMWTVRLPAADGVFIFGIEHIMAQLEAKLDRELKPGTRVVSFALELPGRKPLEIRHGIFLYQF